MDIYRKQIRWKIGLAIAGMVILALSSIYTWYLVNNIQKQEKNSAELLVFAMNSYSKLPQIDSLDDVEVGWYLEIMESNQNIPVIVENEREKLFGINFGGEKDFDEVFLKKELDRMKSRGGEPLIVHDGVNQMNVYYKQSRILTLISYFPLFQIILISTFIALGYLALSAARRAEQNRVWVGMAKETAHQLGTPITAIMGWLELLKQKDFKDDLTREALRELGKDVTRLELIAHRFSKIGAAPDLHAVNVYQELQKCRAYMEPRSPRKVAYDFPENISDSNGVYVNINPPLFDWVIENLVRNALDAMSGKGTISAAVELEGHMVNIDIKDTGKGIPNSQFKRIFLPGMTTKKRGWGLGLSLAKRIIEQYHEGRIFVKNSTPGEGTTFRIQLPKTKMLEAEDKPAES